MEKMKQSFKSPYVLLGILILVTGLFLYSDFIFGDKILAYGDWGYDTKHSYLPMYESFLRRLTEHNINLYDFSYGLGTTWAAKMMLLFDPITIITVLICSLSSKISIGSALVYMQLSKNILGGEFCLIFLKQYKTSNKAAMLTSYIFAFCGYMIAAGQHYMFSSFLILAILLLIAVNRYLEKKKYFFLIFVSALIANMGPYVAFQIYLMIAIYVCIRVCVKDARTINLKIRDILLTGGLIMIGLLISAYSFLLQTYDILNVSSRITTDTTWLEKFCNSWFWVPSDYVKTGFLRFFSNNMEGTVNNWTGAGVHFSALPYFFSTLFILCIGQFIYLIFINTAEKKKKILFCLLLFIFIFSTCNAFIPMLFNVFSGLEYRYVFVWIPFFALLMAYTLDKIFIAQNFSRFINFLITIVAILFVAFAVNVSEQYALYAKYAALLSLSLCAIILDFNKIIINTNAKFKEKIVFILLFIVLSVELMIDNKIVLFAERSLMTKNSYYDTYQDENMKALVNYISKIEGNNFFRIDRTYIGYGTPDVMLSSLFPYRSLSIYNSTINSNLVEYTLKFHPEISYVNQVSYNLRSYGAIFDPIIASSLGLKYLVSDYKREIKGWTLVKEFNDRFLYKNDFLHSAGLIYENAISQSEFERLSGANKKTLISQAIVLEDQDIKATQNKVSESYYEVSKDAIVQISSQNGIILAPDKNNAINLKGVTPDTVLTILFDPSKINIEDKESFLRFTILSGKEGNISVTYNNGISDTLLDVNSSYLNILPDFKTQEIIMPLMPDTASIRISCFESDIILQNIEVISNASIKYTNDYIDFNNANMGNIVEGTVQLTKNGFLMLPIVYENGWHVYVDGLEREILRANFGFSAVKLEEGTHEITFKYISPVLSIAIAISFTGWGCVIILYLHHRKAKWKGRKFK